MSALSPIGQTDLRAALGTRAVTKPTVAGSGAVATVTSTGTNQFLVDGVFYTFAAWTVQSVAVTHSFLGLPVAVQPAYVQPINTTVHYVIGINAAGTVCVVQGSYAGQPIAATSQSQAALGVGGLPQLPAGYAPLSVLKVVTAGSTFTPGTTLWNAGGFTATFTDVSVLPSVAP